MVADRCTAADTTEYRALIGRSAELVIRWRLSSEQADQLFGMREGGAGALILGEDTASDEVRERLRCLVRIDALARRLLADDTLVIEWLETSCAGLAHVSPLQALSTGLGHGRIEKVLMRELAESEAPWL